MPSKRFHTVHIDFQFLAKPLHDFVSNTLFFVDLGLVCKQSELIILGGASPYHAFA